MSTYLFGRTRLTPNDDGFADALAAAHAERLRPRCLCRPEGTEMYVARFGNSFVIKRMPYSGNRHTVDCPSYEPPLELSGLGQVLGAAIREDPLTGQTFLRFNFPLSKVTGRQIGPSTALGGKTSAATDGVKLSLLGLLHYLWDQAELTRWHPAFTGKRTWATVRRQLLKAAEHKIARGEALSERLYVPETFAVEEREAIDSRRVAHWSTVTAGTDQAKRLMLLIAELKEIRPSHFGFKAVIKHIPDLAFAVDGRLYARLTRCFEDHLALWNSAEGVRMVMAATFQLSETFIPTIAQISLMPVTVQWLPIEDSFEHQLVVRLVREQRVFRKPLRYDMASASHLPAAILLDAGPEPFTLWISRERFDGAVPSKSVVHDAEGWHWSPGESRTPPLPCVFRTKSASDSDPNPSPPPIRSRN